MSSDDFSAQRYIKTTLHTAFILDHQHLQQLDQILRTGNASIEYVVMSEALIFTTYNTAQGVLQADKSPTDPIAQIAAKRVTSDTHVKITLRKYTGSRTAPIEFTIRCDDGQRPDFRAQMMQQISDWVDQIKTSQRYTMLSYRPGIAAIILIPMVFLIMIGVFLSLPWLTGAAGVAGSAALVLGLIFSGRFLPVGQFHFDSKRKREET